MKVPHISVIIPTYNRAKQLERCLDALCKQIYRGQWEVVIVDDGSVFDLNELISNYQTKLNISLIIQENTGPAKARNHGAKKAQGSYLIFLDDDCEPQSSWLENLTDQTKPGIMQGGKTVNKLILNDYSEASQLIVSFLYDAFQHTPWSFFTSNNFLVDKETFINLEGFDETFPTSAGEDQEFCLRWTVSGNKMNYVPTAVINHAHDLNFASYWRQHFKYGKVILKCQKKAASLNIPPKPFRFSFYFELLSFPFQSQQWSFVKKIKLSFLILISQMATFCGIADSLYSK